MIKFFKKLHLKAYFSVWRSKNQNCTRLKFFFKNVITKNWLFRLLPPSKWHQQYPQTCFCFTISIWAEGTGCQSTTLLQEKFIIVTIMLCTIMTNITDYLYFVRIFDHGVLLHKIKNIFYLYLKNLIVYLYCYRKKY